MTGWSLVNSGGVTKSLLGTMLRVKCTLAKKRQKVTDGNKTKMSWILGSALPFGHSLLWAGLMSTQKTSNVTSQRQHWSQVMTSSSSGCLVWSSNHWNSLVVSHSKTSLSTDSFVTSKDVRCLSHSVTVLTQWMLSRNMVLMPSVGSFQTVLHQVKTCASLTRKWMRLGTSLTRFGTSHVTSSWTMKDWPWMRHVKMWLKWLLVKQETSQTVGFSTTSTKRSVRSLKTLISLSLVWLVTSSTTSSGTSLLTGMLSWLRKCFIATMRPKKSSLVLSFYTPWIKSCVSFTQSCHSWLKKFTAKSLKERSWLRNTQWFVQSLKTKKQQPALKLLKMWFALFVTHVQKWT